MISCMATSSVRWRILMAVMMTGGRAVDRESRDFSLDPRFLYGQTFWGNRTKLQTPPSLEGWYVGTRIQTMDQLGVRVPLL